MRPAHFSSLCVVGAGVILVGVGNAGGSPGRSHEVHGFVTGAILLPKAHSPNAATGSARFSGRPGKVTLRVVQGYHAMYQPPFIHFQKI
jgi:hypothetical protein